MPYRDCPFKQNQPPILPCGLAPVSHPSWPVPVHTHTVCLDPALLTAPMTQDLAVSPLLASASTLTHGVPGPSPPDCAHDAGPGRVTLPGWCPGLCGLPAPPDDRLPLHGWQCAGRCGPCRCAHKYCCPGPGGGRASRCGWGSAHTSVPVCAVCTIQPAACPRRVQVTETFSERLNWLPWVPFGLGCSRCC